MKLFFTLFLLSIPSMAIAVTDKEREELKWEARDMFNHAFGAYMENAWPADELMPLSCRGRYRGVELSRGDIDDALGNFSLTLIDSLDMLVVLGDLEEFEEAVIKVIKHVSFDKNIVVSVFETNIRVVGGLVSAHVLAELVRDRHNKMTWYRGELLNMAVDIGTRLLPAFNSTTGLPFPRVNLQSGLRGVAPVQMTCTACAGSMILEFAALSRLSGEAVFEEKASKAMDVLWASRHRQSNLVGNVLNVNTGDWIRRDSGVGAGIDSYYEYVAKAYVLLGDYKYLERWNTHYHAVMKYLGTGPLMMDVHMHRPHTNSKHFADSLGAFWPGLQVLMGDLKPAIEQHEVLYQIMQRHNFIPEAVTADFQIHWGQHLLRPEFVESTYFLYRATKDPHYLEVGKKILKALQKYSRVTCGYAAIKDVRTMQHEDRMDSFVLSETFKYLYLLFAKDEDLLLDMHQFVFTTEAHLLPLSLARLSNATAVPMDDYLYDTVIEDEDVEFAEACPSVHYLFPDHESNRAAAASVREPLARVVEDSCPSQKIITRKLTASQFQTGNEQHMKLVKDMGITIISLPDGRVQLLHTFANAKSPDDAEEGLLFMQEMIELSKQQASQAESPPKLLTYFIDGVGTVLQAGPAQFGKELINGVKVTGELVLANSLKACGGSLQNGPSMLGKIVVVERGDCMFVEKARVLQSLGAIGGIVLDNAEGTSAASSPLFAMSGDGTDDINIPLIFLFTEEARIFMKALHENLKLMVTLREKPEAEQSGSHGICKMANERVEVFEPINMKQKKQAIQLQIVEDNQEIIKPSKDGNCSLMDYVNDVFFGKPQIGETEIQPENTVFRMSGVNANKLLKVLGERTAMGMQVTAESIQHLIHELNDNIRVIKNVDENETMENKNMFERKCKSEKIKGIGGEDIIGKVKFDSKESEDKSEKGNSDKLDEKLCSPKGVVNDKDEEENILIRPPEAFVSYLEEENEEVGEDDDDDNDFESSVIQGEVDDIDSDKDYDDYDLDEITEEDQDYYDFMSENDLIQIKNLEEEEIDDEESEDDEYDIEEEEEDEDEIIINDPDLLDEDTLDMKLKETDHFIDKLEVLADLIDILSVKVNDRDIHVKKQAMKSLVVYSAAMGELEKKVPDGNPNQRNQFLSSKSKLENIRRNCLGKAKMFEEFADKAWEVFEMFSNESIYQIPKSKVTELTNDFIFNYHYANELMKVILDGDNEEEIEMVEEGEEDMLQMSRMYTILGFDPDEDFEEEEDMEEDVEPETEEEDPEENENIGREGEDFKREDDKEDSKAEEGYSETEETDTKLLKGVSESNQDTEENEANKNYPKRKLLSVEPEVAAKNDESDVEVNPDGYCSKEDSSCKNNEKRRFAKQPKTTEMKPQKSVIQRCTEFLEKTNKHVESAKQQKTDFQKLDPKNRLIHLRKYMNAKITEKNLVDEHQKIVKNLKDENDKALCQPLLKAAILGLYQIQLETEDLNLMGELSSLMQSSDSEVTDGLKDLMEKLAKLT